MAGTSPEWDALRRRIRILETSLDAKLALYSGLATRIASGHSARGSASGRLGSAAATAAAGYGSYPLSSLPGATSGTRDDDDDVRLDIDSLRTSRANEEAAEIADDESEIETLLSELSGAVVRIDELADQDGRGVVSIQTQAALRRYREVLHDLKNDYARLHGNLRDAQAKRDLLGNVRSDILYVLSALTPLPATPVAYSSSFIHWFHGHLFCRRELLTAVAKLGRSPCHFRPNVAFVCFFDRGSFSSVECVSFPLYPPHSEKDFSRPDFIIPSSTGLTGNVNKTMKRTFLPLEGGWITRVAFWTKRPRRPMLCETT